MKNLSREGILRMMGMRDTAGFLNKINALFIDIYDEGGKLAEYSTQLIVTSKNITLLAQRVTDTETGIANLTVQYNQISATVTSINTTVGGHTTQIGQLQVTTQQLTASVSSVSDTVSGHTTQIGQLTITTTSISQSVSSLQTTVNGQTSQISTLRTDLDGISATVTADHTTLGTHTTQIGSLQVTTNSISGRVTAIEGDYVKEAEISLMVKKDGSGYISNASIKADNILFTFTQTTNFVSGGRNVMVIDNSGNLSILGTLTAGCVIGNLSVDNSGNISGTGSVTTDNVVAGYMTQEITVPSTNNSVTDITCSAGLFVFLKGSTSANTHYFRLPTLSDIRSVLGITSTNKFFSARMVILNQSEAYHCYLTYRDGYGSTTDQPWKMTFDDTHRTGGDAVTQLAVGDYIEILLIYNPTKGEYRAYEVVHNN